MKNQLQVVAASVLVILFAVTGLAQTERKTIPILGGYHLTDADRPEVIEAAEFAIGTENQKKGVSFELIKILTAESQSVQGTKYRVCIEANVLNSEDEEPETKQFLVVVYSTLKNKLSLTSWLEIKCSK